MPIVFTLTDVPPFDGVYEADFKASPFNNRELHWIKETSGVRLGEMEEAANAGDNDLLVAWAAIAVIRSGKARKENYRDLTDLLFEAEGGKITAKIVKEDADADPPAEAAAAPTPDEKQPSSSADSNGTGDASQVTNPASTGHRG